MQYKQNTFAHRLVVPSRTATPERCSICSHNDSIEGGRTGPRHCRAEQSKRGIHRAARAICRNMEDDHSDVGSDHACATGAMGSASVVGSSKPPSLKGETEADASSKSPPLNTQGLSEKIDELKAKQAAMLAERKRVTKDHRNMEKGGSD